MQEKYIDKMKDFGYENIDGNVLKGGFNFQ